MDDMTEQTANTPQLSQPPTMNGAEAKRLLAGTFVEELIKDVASHTTYLVFGAKGSNGEALDLRYGTCFFLQTPIRLLMVTARHVVEAFRIAKEKYGRTFCQIGNLPFDLGSRLIISTKQPRLPGRSMRQN
jgi:hypothetical protein